MGKLESAVEDGWLSENDILGSHSVGLHDVLGTAIPDEVCHTIAIRKMGYQQLVALAGIYLIVTENLAFELYKRHVGIEFADVENLGAVYIFIWIVFQQVTIRVDAELLAQYLFLLGSYPWQEHDVLV